METVYGNARYWLTFGYKVARLAFLWGKKDEKARLEFQRSLNEVLEMLRVTAPDCRPAGDDFGSFAQSILFYFSARDQTTYSCIRIGMCQFTAGPCTEFTFEPGTDENTTGGRLLAARSLLDDIPTSIVADKNELFAVILENADNPVWIGQERILEYLDSGVNTLPQAHQSADPSGDKVFIVHGRDWDARDDVEQLLWRIGLHPIIIMNEPSQGETIIEKIERNCDVSFAIVLYTACDDGKAKEDKALRSRARQNVVFEHGYMVAKLGRNHVVALVEERVETPGDLDGVVYISLSASDWKHQLMRELEAAGLTFDWAKA